MQEIQKTRVRSLSWEDPLEEGMAIHSNILAWRIPWTEEPGRLQSMRSQRIGYNWSNGRHTSTSTHLLSSFPHSLSICIIYDVSMLLSLIPVQSYRLPSSHVANLVCKSEKRGSHFFPQCFYSSIQSWDTLSVVSDLLIHITSRKKRKMKEWERKKQRETEKEKERREAEKKGRKWERKCY